MRAVAGRDEPALRAALAQLEEAELLFRSGMPPDARYTFKHALVQDTAYETLLKSRRQILHRQIADARLAKSECLLVGVKPSDQAGAPFSDAAE